MIFHLPWTPDIEGNRAPLIRPARMLAAFQENGWNVLEVTGPRAQRRQAMQRVHKFLENGGQIDMVYSECATTPTTIIEPGHWPPVPFLDANFLGWLSRRGIPIGLFYRDVYWRLDDYKRMVRQPLRGILKILYRHDLRGYSRFLKYLYLPTLEMGQTLPIFPQSRMRTLPPGGIIPQSPAVPSQSGELRLLYVGALGHYYRIDTLLKALRAVPQAHLTVVTQKEQWETYRCSLPHGVPANVSFQPASGEKLQQIYARTDLSMLFMESNQFRELTLPVKLFEAIGWACPLVAGEGSMAGRFVAENQAGWVLPVVAQDLIDLLQDLVKHPQKLAGKRTELSKIRENHTWNARARQVENDLLGRLATTAESKPGEVSNPADTEESNLPQSAEE